MASSDEYQQKQFFLEECLDTDELKVQMILAEIMAKNKDVFRDKFYEQLVFGTTSIHYDSETGLIS